MARVQSLQLFAVEVPPLSVVDVRSRISNRRRLSLTFDQSIHTTSGAVIARASVVCVCVSAGGALVRFPDETLIRVAKVCEQSHAGHEIEAST